LPIIVKKAINTKLLIIKQGNTVGGCPNDAQLPDYIRQTLDTGS